MSAVRFRDYLVSLGYDRAGLEDRSSMVKFEVDGFVKRSDGKGYDWLVLPGRLCIPSKGEKPKSFYLGDILVDGSVITFDDGTKVPVLREKKRMNHFGGDILKFSSSSSVREVLQGMVIFDAEISVHVEGGAA